MALCPFAEFIGPVPNRRPGGMVHPVKFVVEHVEAGTEQGSISWFQNPLAKVSAHFLIALDGTLHQAVDTDDVAWAEANFNPHAYSVETEGTPATALTDAQVHTFAKLITWLHGLDSFPLVVTDDPNGPGGFITHGALGTAGGGHPSCPGPLRAAQRQHILDLAQGPQNPVQPSGDSTRIGPPQTFGDDMNRTPVHVAPLDAQGNGYVTLAIPFEKIVNVMVLGPAPQRDSYSWPNVFHSENNTNGQLEVELEGGTPGGSVDIVVWSVT